MKVTYEYESMSLRIAFDTTIQISANEYDEICQNNMSLVSTTGTGCDLRTNPNSFISYIQIFEFDKYTQKQQELLDKLIQGVSLENLAKIINLEKNYEVLEVTYNNLGGGVQIEEVTAWKSNVPIRINGVLI